MTTTQQQVERLDGLLLRSSADEAAALEDLHRLGCTDGLPVVVPTPERVERMVIAGGQPGDLSLGSISPYEGDATVRAVAACSVMAGCLPDYFPVVLAAVRALCDPALDMGEVQVTTHQLGPMLIVNGPGRYDYGPFESQTGALGPGNRANASVGRAVRLCLLNIGGGRPGIGDMALFGSPAKFTFCLAEDEESSPFPPLHTRLGFDPAQTTVTVVNVEAPHSVVCLMSEDTAATAERLLRQLASAVGNPASNNATFGWGEVVVILNPEHAKVLFSSDYSVDDVRQRISDLTAKPRKVLYGNFEPDADPEELVRVAAENILVIVAGGGGGYSLVVPSWGYGVHRNRHVTTEVTYGEACAVPLPVSPPDASHALNG